MQSVYGDSGDNFITDWLTSKRADAIPSLVELFTTAKQLCIAAWRSHAGNGGKMWTPGNLQVIVTVPKVSNHEI